MTVPDKILTSPQLPTLPSVAVRLLELTRNPDAEISDVITTIRTDPAISAKILKASNSSYFGFRAKITSIDRAVPLLGTNVVTSLALGFSLTDSTTTTGPMYQYYNAYWLRSVVHAAASEMLGQKSEPGLECEYFLAGLLADIGRLAMLKTIAKEYTPVLTGADGGTKSLHTLEIEELGFSHTEVGARLMESWDLPPAFMTATTLHHEALEQLKEHEDGPQWGLIKAIATASSVAEYFCGESKGQAYQSVKALTQECYGFSESELNEFLTQVSHRIDEAGELFSMDTSHIPEPSELLAQANEQLTEIAMRAHVENTQAQNRQRSIEEEKKNLETQNKQLMEEVIHDPLTRVYNRRFFDETMIRETGRAIREAIALGVLFIDIDHFKRINDTYGHHCGDFVLQQVSAAIGESLRSSDVLARYGGEEFVILVNQPTEKGIGKLAERIRKRIEDKRIVFNEQAISVTISVGASIVVPHRQDKDVTSRLINAADAAMYDSKHNGRNQAHVRSLINESERQLMQKVTQQRFSRWLVDRGILDIPTVSRALLQCRPESVRIGELAQRNGYLAEGEVHRILKTQQETGERFGSTAVNLGLLQESEVVHLLAQQKEDAALLKRVLVQMELLDEKGAETLLGEYIADRVPKQRAVLATL